MSPSTRSAVYEIRLAGLLDAAVRHALHDEVVHLEVTPAHGETVLRGPLRDEAELQGVLQRLRAVGARLVEVRRLG